MLPTGTYRTLTTGKFSMGPIALAFHTGRKWIVGTVVQHWCSVAGDSTRGSVNLTDILYVVQYRLTPTTSIGFSPNIRINWTADSRNRLALDRHRRKYVDQIGALAGQGGGGIPMVSRHPRNCRA